MNIGYARVSSGDQCLALQEDALNRVGCTKIFTDKISGRVEQRDGLNLALSYLRSGDNIVVYSLSRLGRSLKQLIEIVNELENKNIGLISITEQIDTSSPSGKLLFHLLASLAQFEADLIKQRTLAGLEAARARGKVGGRPKKLSDSDIMVARTLYGGGISLDEICAKLSVSRATLYRSDFLQKG